MRENRIVVELVPARVDVVGLRLGTAHHLGYPVDIVIVHAPGLAGLAIEALRAAPPDAPLLVVQGHTHKQSLDRSDSVTVLNSGSVGGGGTGNLREAGGDIGLARLTYTAQPAFEPRAADLVQIDPGDGEAQARRFRLDDPAEP